MDEAVIAYLWGEGVMYLFLDGVYLKMRVGKRPAEAALVAHGISAEGKPTLLDASRLSEVYPPMSMSPSTIAMPASMAWRRWGHSTDSSGE